MDFHIFHTFVHLDFVCECWNCFILCDDSIVHVKFCSQDFALIVKGKMIWEKMTNWDRIENRYFAWTLIMLELFEMSQIFRLFNFNGQFLNFVRVLKHLNLFWWNLLNSIVHFLCWEFTGSCLSCRRENLLGKSEKYSKILENFLWFQLFIIFMWKFFRNNLKFLNFIIGSINLHKTRKATRIWEG
jgi:hypothetical protein